MAFKPIICVDFDGVLHAYNSGWKGVGVISDGPTPGALDWLRDLYLDGKVTVAIHSSRSKSLRGRWAMQRWLYRHLKEHFGYQAGPWMDPLYLEICEWVKWPWFKPSAFVSIDDRAIQFNGAWPSQAEMLAFKPWNKKP